MNSILVVVLVLGNFLCISEAGLDQKGIQGFLDAHKTCRESVQPSPKAGSGYSTTVSLGENLAFGAGDKYDPAKVDSAVLAGYATKGWCDEKKDYDLKENKCNAGAVCGHYTQVVWQDSLTIGCAIVPCQSEIKGTMYPGYVAGCVYQKAGNMGCCRPYQGEGAPEDGAQCSWGSYGNSCGSSASAGAKYTCPPSAEDQAKYGTPITEKGDCKYTYEYKCWGGAQCLQRINHKYHVFDNKS